MKHNLNRVLAGVFALSLLTLTGCSSAKQNDGMSIYVICKSQDEYWDTTKAGSLEAGEEMGLNVTYEAPETEDQVDVQINMINDAIANGAKAIVLAPLDTDALNDTLAAATEAGVPVLTIDSDVSYEGRASCISTQNYSAGAIAARYAASLIDESGNVAVISHSDTAQTAVERAGGFVDEIEGNSSSAPGSMNTPTGSRFPGDTAVNTPPDIAPADDAQSGYPAENTPPDAQISEAPAGDTAPAAPASSSSGYADINIIETKLGNGDIQQSREAAVQLIKENPDLKLIYATNQPGTIGACQAIAELGVGDKVQLVGFDYFDGADAYITDGVLDAVVAQNPYNMGYLGVRYAKKLVSGEQVAANVDTGATLVTPDNLNDDDIRFLVNPTGK